MAIRKILGVLATLLILLGLSQLAFTNWWLQRMPGIVNSPSLYLGGLPLFVFGLVLIIAVLERAVGLRLFLTILALFILAAGALTLANPGLTRDVLHTTLMDRSRGFQVFVLWASGIGRMIIGFVIVYALLRPSRPVIDTTAEAPLEQ